MANENRRTKIALFLVMLMVLTPLASGANISNFSSGSSEVDILLNDATTYSDNVDGSIDLPLGESITSASMAVERYTVAATIDLVVCTLVADLVIS